MTLARLVTLVFVGFAWFCGWVDTTFRGSFFEDINQWLGLIEDQLRLHGQPQELWTLAASGLLREEARLWWVEQRKANNGMAPSWEVFKAAIKAKYDTDLRADEIRLKMEALTFKGDLDDYILKFRKLVAQLPDSEMTFHDKRRNFLRPLPAEFAAKIRSERPATLELTYAAARDWHQVTLQAKHRPQPSSQGYGMRPRVYSLKPCAHRLLHDMLHHRIHHR